MRAPVIEHVIALLAIVVVVVVIWDVGCRYEMRRLKRDREDAWRAAWLAYHREHEPGHRDNCPYCRGERLDIRPTVW